jgi:hypothetical protein
MRFLETLQLYFEMSIDLLVISDLVYYGATDILDKLYPFNYMATLRLQNNLHFYNAASCTLSSLVLVHSKQMDVFSFSVV